MFRGDFLIDGDVFILPAREDDRPEPKRKPRDLDLRSLHGDYLLDDDVLLKSKFVPVTEVRFVESILVQ